MLQRKFKEILLHQGALFSTKSFEIQFSARAKWKNGFTCFFTYAKSIKGAINILNPQFSS
jgi:hypothetical protein